MTFSTTARLAGKVPASGLDTYGDVVLADSPLAYYILGESSGTDMLDSSGNGRHGTYTGITNVLGQAGIPGSTATAALFDGTADAGGEVADAAWMDVTTALCVEVWFKSTSSSGEDFLVARDRGTGDDRAFGLRLDTLERAELLVFNSAGANSSPSATTALHDGDWHHVVGQWDGSTIEIWVDNVREVNTAFSGSMRAVTRDLGIGRRFGGAGYPATYAHVALYDGTLSSTRIAAHYNAGSTAP